MNKTKAFLTAKGVGRDLVRALLNVRHVLKQIGVQNDTEAYRRGARFYVPAPET